MAKADRSPTQYEVNRADGKKSLFISFLIEERWTEKVGDMQSDPTPGSSSHPTPNPVRLSHADLLQLKRWNTPTIYNGWEQITGHNAGRDAFNLEETRDFMPQMGPMVGYAVTCVVEPGNPEHPSQNSNAWSEYRRYVASQPGPKIVVMQDLDKPMVYGSAWGEVTSNIHRALGCVGVIVDGSVRDVDEMTNAGFKALARRLSVGHAFSCPVRWNCEVEVFGRKVSPGQLIHADKHGFLAVPFGEESGLLEAARFMDTNECRHLISVARQSAGQPTEVILKALDEGSARFGKEAQDKFGRKGEWWAGHAEEESTGGSH